MTTSEYRWMIMSAMGRILAIDLYVLQPPWGRLVLQKSSIPVSVLSRRAEIAKHPLQGQIGIIRVAEISEMLLDTFQVYI